MKIIDLDFLDKIADKESILGSQGSTISDISREISDRLETLTGQLAGLLGASFNVIAQGNGSANTSLDVNYNSDLGNKISIQFQSVSKAIAINPGG